MCGIFSYLYKNENLVDYNLLKEYGNRCNHRGPDKTTDINIHLDDYSLFMMFHRLAINGLSELGDQPICKNNISVICNGEIYNYKELASKYHIKLTEGASDCEILIYLYNKIGIDKMIRELDGVFSFILFDFTKKKLIIGHDPIGVRSLYWFKDNGVGIASEMKCLTNLSSNINMYPPGTYTEINLENNEFNTVQYYDFIYPEINDDETLIRNNLRLLLNKSVEKRLMADREIGCLLSGGFDSSFNNSFNCKKYKKSKNFLYWLTRFTRYNCCKESIKIFKYRTYKYNFDRRRNVSRNRRNN